MKTVPVSNKFLFLADFHVKARTWTNNTQVRGDAYAAMDVIGAYAEQNELDTLVIGGDFFDSNRPTPEDLVHTVDFLSQFKRVYYIRGNHDSCDPSYLEGVSRILGNKNFVIQLDGELVFVGNNSYLTGISWMPSKEEYRLAIQELLADFKMHHPGETLYLVLHTSFKHLLSFDGAYTFDIDQIEPWCEGMDVNILVGDVHVHNTTDDYLNGKGFLCVHSPGSVYPLQFNESDTVKCVTVVNVDDDPHGSRINPVPIEVRKYATWHYTEAGSLKEYLTGCAELHRAAKEKDLVVLPTYIRIVVDTGVEPPHIIPSDYPNLVIQIQTEMDEFDPGHAIDSADGTYTLEQAINDEFADPDVAEIANKLVTSPDPAEDLRQYLDFWQVERTTM